MLSIAGMAQGQEGYYLELAREDYYLSGGEPPGRWWGRGAAALRLEGEVAREDLSSMLAGMSPDGQSLGQLQTYSDGRSRRPGWDLTFSAPKSVSVLWAFADEEMRTQISAAHETAVRAALAYLQDVAAWTRRGKAGESLEHADLAVAMFEHGTSRAQDPQLHTHCLVVNAGLREDDTWGALESLGFYRHKMAAGALYRLELARALYEEVRVDVERRGWSFEVAGVPDGLVEDFSTRAQAIREAMAEFGVDGPKAAELFAKTTRKVKEHVAREELVQLWRDVGVHYGFTTESAAALRHGFRIELGPPPLHVTVAHVLGRHFQHESVISERDLIRAVANDPRSLRHGVDEVMAAVTKALKSSDLVELETHSLARAFTTREMLSLEKEVLALSEASKKHNNHAIQGEALFAALARNPEFNQEQRAALIHITANEGSIQCLSGMAGTGKTKLLRAACETWEASGYRVLGTALAGKAALGLEEAAGPKSFTVAKLLYMLETDLFGQLAHHGRQLVRAALGKETFSLERAKLDANTIVVVDEASMVGTKHWAQLTKLAAKAGAKLVFVGDERQLPAVDAGAPFRAVQSVVGAARLVTIVRQREEWMKEAVHEFARGETRSALTRYAEHGRLHVEKTRDDALTRLVNDWTQRRTEKLSETLVLASTNVEVKELNRRIQEKRLERGEISRLRSARIRGRIETTAHKPGQLRDFTVRQGDRVVFTKNSRVQGFWNGDFGTVESIARWTYFGPQTAVVRLDRDGKRWWGKAATRVTVSLDKDVPLELGYASTVHKAQGVTVDRALVLAGSAMEDRSLAYVQMSRARDETHIYSDSSTAGEDITELARRMERERQKEMALDYGERQRPPIEAAQQMPPPTQTQTQAL